MIKASYRMLWLISSCCNPYIPDILSLHRLYGAMLALDEDTTDFKILSSFYHRQYLRIGEVGNRGKINLDNVPKRLHAYEVENNEPNS